MTALRNQPAFPFSHNEKPDSFYREGLSKREYYAALALQGLLANPVQVELLRVNIFGIDTAHIANIALEAADALLKAMEP